MTGQLPRVRHRLRRPRPGGTKGPAESFDRRLLAPMMLGSVLNPVNSSILSVSLVPIGAAFGAPPSQTAWLVSGLYLATAIGQPVVGRLIDLFGPRRLFLAGTALTGIAGVIGMLAPNLGTLVAARVLLGFGTCAGFPAAMYLIRSEARRTGQESPAGVLTALAVTTQTIAVIGPSLGGLLIGVGGWRATLAVNVPLAMAGSYLGARRIPATPASRRGDGRHPVRDLDLPGMGLFSVALVCLLLFLMNRGGGHRYLLVLVVVTAAGFAWRELRAREPFIDVRILGGNLPLLATYARALLCYVVSYAFLYGYTQWTQQGRGLSASQTGLVQLPLFLTAIVVSTLTGRRAAVRGKLLVGALGQVVACALLFLLHDRSPVWMLVAVVVVLGAPQGLNKLALQNAVFHQADGARIGSSAGLLRTFGYLGAIVASAANGVFFGRRADTGGLHHLAAFLLVVSALFLAVTVADRSLRRVGLSRPNHAPAGTGPPHAGP